MRTANIRTSLLAAALLATAGFVGVAGIDAQTQNPEDQRPYQEQQSQMGERGQQTGDGDTDWGWIGLLGLAGLLGLRRREPDRATPRRTTTTP